MENYQFNWISIQHSESNHENISNAVKYTLCSLYSSYLENLLVLRNFQSVQFSRSVVSNSLPPHESQHARPPCPSPTPRVYSNSCPVSQWYYPAISSSVIPFSSCPQSLPASGSFPISQLFTWGGQVYPTAKKKKKNPTQQLLNKHF